MSNRKKTAAEPGAVLNCPTLRELRFSFRKFRHIGIRVLPAPEGAVIAAVTRFFLAPADVAMDAHRRRADACTRRKPRRPMTIAGLPPDFWPRTRKAHHLLIIPRLLGPLRWAGEARDRNLGTSLNCSGEIHSCTAGRRPPNSAGMRIGLTYSRKRPARIVEHQIHPARAQRRKGVGPAPPFTSVGAPHGPP